METNQKTAAITVQTLVHAPIDKVWKCWTNPQDVMKWNNASDDWHTPWAKNDLQKGGRFSFRMEAKDGSFGFDFGGEYTNVVANKLIEYKLGDNRKVSVAFSESGNETRVEETFEAETENSLDMQRSGWQSILDNFKRYVEAN